MVMIENKIWLRGKIIPESEATVNVLSPASQFGLNVFEGIRCYRSEDKKILYAVSLNEHIDRLIESCRLIGIKPPYTKNQMIDFFKQTVLANNYEKDVAVRMTIFGDGIGSWSSTSNFDMFIAPIERERTDIDKLIGKSACISSWQRINDNILPPRAKVGANYINGRYGYLQAQRDGYDLPIFLGNDGKVTESSGACIFIIKNKKIITPDITSSILESITRNIIIEFAKLKGIKVEERKVDRTELYLADELFLAGTAAEITPVTSIDKFNINDKKIGEITYQLYKEYLDFVSGKSDRYKHSLEKII
jgi:branched-chain amino acid aminotransferase